MNAQLERSYEISGNKEGTPGMCYLGDRDFRPQILIPTARSQLSSSTGGGPGGGTDTKDRSFFDPTKYKVCLSHLSPVPRSKVTLDFSQVFLLYQRGSCKYTP